MLEQRQGGFDLHALLVELDVVERGLMTVEREWTRARAYLHRALSQRPPVPEADAGAADTVGGG